MAAILFRPHVWMKYLYHHKENHWLLSPNSELWNDYITNNNLQITQSMASQNMQNITMAIHSLWPSDAIWRQRSRSTLAQIMACCLTAPSHYLNQCWLIISEVQRHSSEDNFTIDTSAINHLKIPYLKFHSNLPGANELKAIFNQSRWSRSILWLLMTWTTVISLI